MAIIKINNNAIDLNAAEIPNLDAAKITTGQFADAKIADVASSKITGTITPSDATVSIAKLTATGTKDATTFLRGDNTFAEAGGGKILQVLGATDSTNRSTTSTSFVTASNTLSVAITPTSTSSKIFILVNCNIGQDGANNRPRITIFRDATNLGNSDGMGFLNYTSGDFHIPASISYLDSPSSTSELTYQLYIKCSSGTAIINSSYPVAATLKSSITVMEIAG